jgi:hypothetical protein
MANDTTTPADIKDHIVDYISKLEKRIVNEKPETQDEIEENKKKLLAELEKYKREVYYSINRPNNTNCPHWRKYALSNNSQSNFSAPSENNNKKTFSVNSPASPKPSSNTGIIIIVIFATFLVIGLGYLVWKKVVKK